MRIFRELKAKKMKYGFTTGIGSSNVVALGMFLGTTLRGAKEGKDFVLEGNVSGSSHEIKLYTNDDRLAEHIRNMNSLEVPTQTQAFLDGGNLFEKALAERHAIGDEPDGPDA